MHLEEILPKLQAWFKPEEHKKRKLPGGKEWFYVPHQLVRDRLNQVCPGEWETSYQNLHSGDYVIVYCTLTIWGKSRQGVAENKIFPELNDEGKPKIIGSPVVNATRRAFRNAAEQFGIAVYLERQRGDEFVQYMKQPHCNSQNNNGVPSVIKPPLSKEEQFRKRLLNAAAIAKITQREMIEIASSTLDRPIQSAKDILSDAECLAVEKNLLSLVTV